MSRLWYAAIPLTVAAGAFLTLFYKVCSLSAQIEDEHRAEEKLHD